MSPWVLSFRVVIHCDAYRLCFIKISSFTLTSHLVWVVVCTDPLQRRNLNPIVKHVFTPFYLISLPFAHHPRDRQRNELESIIASSLKTNISVVGPSEITNHQSFDPRVLKELKIPEGAGGGGGFDRSIPYPGEEDEFEEAEDNAYTLP